ncbi:hypothetical protein Kpol_513p3 [Vanderwaltozyma polyspora DSM 70294]|uniref:Inner centromere protein ARK-binding domain-containing protein n=1 Tax=Vanderwaltozyma polyspora (strain ATCC 22028 / DSM 70294 / BCRC 21397 / CBS 2163 / NBRC 10782 / NRRL Y-8283 / UCD 57-17) TaxID=436907 RepID=A7TMI9_VANPO|nr:uncharacterized protein Kpol_513p3 [Vanderwaltozyma polyspora DSM 70294]EDO16487.1 hypothetical protein Kpol_513p3 [Vanderwaltozyma polyspora DSM 70294]
MDWAIQAAKKKTETLAGGSRSIVESLNELNNVLVNGQQEINSVINDTCDWLNKEYSFIKDNSKHINISGGNKLANKNSLVSPEKTIAFNLTDRSTNLSILENKLSSSDIENINPNTNTNNNHNHNHIHTPDRRENILPSVTPKSLAEDNATQELQVQTSNIIENTTSNENSKVLKYSSRKSSPWSPYKADRLLKESTSNSSNNITRIITSSSHHSALSYTNSGESRKDLENANTSTKGDSELEVSRNTSLISINNTEPILKTRTRKSSLRDISKRRSNMFVPLPNKDPLIVQPVTSAQQGTNVLQSSTRKSLVNSRISIHKESVPISHTLLPPNNISRSKSNDRKSPSNNSTITSIKSPSFNVTTTGTITTSVTRSTATTSNVFDRLTSISTKSFENKVISKSARLSSSSIDMAGSPIRRSSANSKITGTIDSTMQEALKSIFSTKERLHNGKTPSRTTSPTSMKKSMIPKLNRYEHNSGTSGIDSKMKSIPNLPVTSKLSPTFKHSSNSRHNKYEIKSSSNNSHLHSEMKIKRDGINTSKNPKSPIRQSNLNKSLHPNSLVSNEELLEKRDVNSGKLEKDSISERTNGMIDSNTKAKSQNNRLTRFKLISSASNDQDKTNQKAINVTAEPTNQGTISKKDTVKGKRESIQKPIVYTDFRSSTTTKKKIPSTNINSSKRNNSFLQNGFLNHNVLHDLNTVDHRTKIGGSSSSITISKATKDEHCGDQSLPEIFSDSDEDENTIIASWAKSPYLEEQLIIQQNWDPKQIFGSIPPLHIDEIFQSSRLNKLKARQSLTKK